MKDLIDKILNFLPQYFLQFGAIFSTPKTYFGSHDLTSDDAFGRALMFIGASLSLVQLMLIPTYAVGMDVWAYIAGQGIFWLAYTIIGGGLTMLVWRVVGGTAPSRVIFIIYGYCLSITSVVDAGLQTVALGYLKLSDHLLYAQVVKIMKNGALHPFDGFADSPPLRIAITVFLMDIVFMLVWMFIAWGAFREAYKTGRLASGIALAIVLILHIPALLVLSAINAALT